MRDTETEIGGSIFPVVTAIKGIGFKEQGNPEEGQLTFPGKGGVDDKCKAKTLLEQTSLVAGGERMRLEGGPA